MTLGKNKPSLVDKAKEAIVHYGLKNKCLVQSKIKEELTQTKNNSLKISKSIFNMAWKDLRDSKRIILMDGTEPYFEDCRTASFKARLFYTLNRDKEPDIYLNMVNTIEKLNSPEKAFSFIEQLTSVFRKLDDTKYWELLAEKFMLQMSKLNFENDDFLTVHFRVLDSFHSVVDNTNSYLSPDALKIMQEEIATFLPKIDDGSCNTISAIGIISSAFSLIWKLNKEMGMAEFVNLANKAIESLDYFRIHGNIEDVKRYFRLLQCYVNASLNFRNYFNKNEIEELLSRMQTIYYTAPDIKDNSLKMIIESILNWFMDKL